MPTQTHNTAYNVGSYTLKKCGFCNNNKDIMGRLHSSAVFLLWSLFSPRFLQMLRSFSLCQRLPWHFWKIPLSTLIPGVIFAVKIIENLQLRVHKTPLFKYLQIPYRGEGLKTEVGGWKGFVSQDVADLYLRHARSGPRDQNRGQDTP